MENKFEEKIKNRLHRAWEEWKPGYEDWIKWSDGLYAPDATIIAIGDEPQRFKDYQKSMKDQRDMFAMDMGAIENCVAEDKTVAISYKMYLTPNQTMGKLEAGKTITIKVTEFNTFAEIPGYDEPMVTRLELISNSL
ncbi:hypothetical protein EHV15_19460 [Paenibacillus oralis]|uniref:Nuclear transport factor 2 family protein n=1 Tax=Paenibacillus oralis TaxID=2490856 RepID=A0A3P3U3Y4_9BACL|nr:hypothetical protein [Paenibacillus oralis]RRJ64854.1 hypothetical protein EHV15_19460 [Paenibacillus oralis]